MVNKVIFDNVPGSGMGDVLLGFISCYWLSKILNYQIYSNNNIILNLFQVYSYFDTSNTEYIEVYNISMLKEYSTVDIIDKYRDKNILIRSYHNFYSTFYKNKYTKDIIQELCPNENECIRYFFQQVNLHHFIKERINELKIPRNTIGIHIRTSRKYPCDDYEITEEGSKIFRDALDMIDNDKNRPILLALDDLDDVKYFEDRNYFLTDSNIPNHCFFDNNINNIIKSFIDIYSLGMCEKVIVSFWSNFSRLAVLRDNTPFYMVKLLIKDNDRGLRYINRKEIELNEKFCTYRCFNVNPISDNEIYREGEHSEILSKHFF